MEFNHTSVLLNECINGLNISQNGIYVDGTLGGAGHSFEICKNLSNNGRLIGIDQDEMAIVAANERLKPYSQLVTIVRENFSSYKNIIKELNIEKVNGILLDLGVSSYQLDNAERGFSYMQDAPLDMRMDQRQEKTAKDIVNGYSEKELFIILKAYGEERFANNIVRNIVRARTERPINTTAELVDIVSRSIPAKNKATGGHPAKRTFQAIRIELNRELSVLKETIVDMIESLDQDGRLCIITFHSLEDRIVKEMFREAEDTCICPIDFPYCTCGNLPKGKVLTRKPILPKDEELENNSRSKSAKLRIFERKDGIFHG
ncbi:MAG: 16S rRNA (cytosine(1402)-N(4))-methyltransferase [Firmicutes bacterium HGW-Firmicutes-1]|nr:MAG: 16S rRNA (cytosine(1402)-N(4))-methyltransferase [Firmicutes bacterium HGW-Firmicutes-1]